MFSNARRVLSQCNTRLRLLYLLNITIVFMNSERGISLTKAIVVLFTRFSQYESRVGAMVRTLVFYLCGQGSILLPAEICGLSSFVLYSVPRGFFSGTPLFPSHQNI